MQFLLKSFNELNSYQLYAILQLREEVFIIEQNCIYKDLDNKDKKAWHLMGFVNDDLVAYARLLPKGVSYPDYCSIGRVVTLPKYRAKNYGIYLMQEAIKHTEIILPCERIKISAQAHLQAFYEKFNFSVNSEPYMEDGILHIEMIR